MTDTWSVNGTTGVGPAIANDRGETVGAMWTLADAERVVAEHNALAGIDDPTSLRAALEELRKAHVKGHGDQWVGQKYGQTIVTFVRNLAKLLPPETP